MNNVSLTKSRRALALLLLAAAFGVAVFAPAPRARSAAAEASARSGRVPPGPRQQPRPKPADDDEEAEEEGGSEGAAAAAVARPQSADPATVLRKARYVYVRSDSAFVSAREVEASLQKRKEFKAWGMVITRSEAQADLVIEITRRPLTRRFTFSVINPATSEVVASGKTRSVLFGKKIPNKIAEKFANRVKVYRPYPPN